MKQRLLSIQREIVQLEKPYPKDDLIKSYKDFLLIRDFLPFYQFNIKVLDSLVDLACTSWHAEERVSRTSLLTTIKRYLKTSNVEIGSAFSRNKPTPLTIEVRLKLFKLFQCCFETPGRLSKKQSTEAKGIANSILMNLCLDPAAEKWLCKNVDQSEHILNRVLRYPIKSKVITQWAQQAATANTYRLRRAELTGWIIDVQPDFTLDKQTLIDDFEHLNAVDKKAIKKYETAIATNLLIENALDHISSEYKFPKPPIQREEGDLEFITTYPDLKLSKRFYNVPRDNANIISSEIPDFDTMRNTFYKNIDTTFKITMLWSIYYSRLDMPLKSELLKKYYCEETYLSFFKICRRLESLELWAWLKGKQQKTS
jgi:hypothetical protein